MVDKFPTTGGMDKFPTTYVNNFIATPRKENFMNMIFDTHAHYDDGAFDADREALLASMQKKGVCAIINCGTNIARSKKSIELAEKYDFICAAVGVHPSEAQDLLAEDLQIIAELAAHEEVVAIGEIGLDYHYDFAEPQKQRRVFEEQLIIAKERDLPVIVHDREAHQDTLALLQKYRPKGVVHCFSGSVEMMWEVVKLGMFIGLGGTVTFKNAIKPAEVAKAVPIEHLLLETDAPYMTPVPFRGNRCDSSHIAYTAQKISDLRGISYKELLQQTKINAEKLFKKRTHET